MFHLPLSNKIISLDTNPHTRKNNANKTLRVVDNVIIQIEQKILCPTDSAHNRISILLGIDEFDSNVTYTDSHVMGPHGRGNVE